MEAAPEDPVVSDDSPPAIEFATGCEEQLWSQVLSSIQDVTRDHARSAAGVAIIGPNKLEISFPASYHFSKTFCEQPKTLAQLETIVSKLTGKAVLISLRLLAAEPAESLAETSPPVETPTETDLSTIDDPFVEQAKAVFGGTVVKVQGISGTAGTSSPNASDHEKD